MPPLALPEPGTRTGRQWPASTPSRCSASARERTTPTSSSGDDNVERDRGDLPTRRRAAAGDRAGGRALRAALARRDRRTPARRARRTRRRARDAPARQQTLRATIDWSHGLLSDDEKACFARFAVFAGGATVEAAETITGAGIDTLDRLVAKSLLVRRQRGTGRPGWGCSKRSGRTPPSASPSFQTAKRCGAPLRYFQSVAATPRTRSGAMTAAAAASTSRGWTARSRTSAPPSDGRSSATRRVAPRDVRGAHRLLDEARPIRGGRPLGRAGLLSQAPAGDATALRARALCQVCWPLWAVGRGASGRRCSGGRDDRPDAVGSADPR